MDFNMRMQSAIGMIMRLEKEKLDAEKNEYSLYVRDMDKKYRECFPSEEDENRYFDNLERARDMNKGA